MHTWRIHYLTSVVAIILLASLVASPRPPAPAPQAAAPLDPSKMPDIYGLHIGMAAQDAKAVLEKEFHDPTRPEPVGFGPGNRQQAIYSFEAGGGPGGSMAADVTLPPNPQLVWHIVRGAPQPNVNRAVVLAALRQKYGKETYAVAFGAVPGKTTTDDSVTNYLVWLMDEQGHPLTGVPLKFVFDRPFDCYVTGGVTTGTRPPGYQPNPDFCAKSLVGLSVSFNEGEIIKSTYTEIVDYPLAQRSAQATDAYTKNGNQQIQQQIQQKSQEIKPNI